MQKELSKKETMFCYYFVETGDLHKAFQIAKMKHASEILPKLMSSRSIRDQISKDYENKKLNLNIKAEVGYERLAFGEIADCVKLMFIKSLDDCKIDSMNLFNISEIKRLKDGTMEIKFFDRMKALEKLIEYKQSEDDIIPFYTALEKGVSDET